MLIWTIWWLLHADRKQPRIMVRKDSRAGGLCFIPRISEVEITWIKNITRLNLRPQWTPVGGFFMCMAALCASISTSWFMLKQGVCTPTYQGIYTPSYMSSKCTEHESEVLCVPVLACPPTYLSSGQTRIMSSSIVCFPVTPISNAHTRSPSYDVELATSAHHSWKITYLDILHSSCLLVTVAELRGVEHVDLLAHRCKLTPTLANWLR
jgi:hypothetical protein